MSMNVKQMKGTSSGPTQEPLDAGTYPARVVQVISLGLQAQRAYLGEEKPPKIDLRITYELSDEFILDEDGNEQEDKPRWVSETLPLNPLSSDLAKSTKRYYALDPEEKFDGDFSKLIGSPCMLTISKEPAKKDPNKVYNNVVSVQAMRAKDAAKLPELKNDPKVFDFYSPDIETFKSLPEWMQGIIKESLDFGGSELEKLLEGGKAGSKEEPKTKEEDDNDEEW